MTSSLRNNAHELSTTSCTTSVFFDLLHVPSVLWQFVVGLGDRVAPTDIEEGMRVGYVYVHLMTWKFLWTAAQNYCGQAICQHPDGRKSQAQ